MTSARTARQPVRVRALVSGASCAGKTTVRTLVAPELEPEVEAVELKDLAPLPKSPVNR